MNALAKQIPETWLDLLMIPDLQKHSNELLEFVQVHQEILNSKIQKLTETLSTFEAVRETACLMMSLALFLAHTIGADTKGLSEHRI